MSFDAKRLYELLPAIYRIRDAALAERGPDGAEAGPLQALLSILAEQIAVVEEDIAQLYDDQFIETCAEWVVPYLADLVGTRGLFDWENAPISQRAQVANTLAYRRRKGTGAVLEQLARDVTGWGANVVEFFQFLAVTQYMNHIRSGNVAWVPMRNPAVLQAIGTPFDQSAHTLDVRRTASGRGKYNIPNIGIYLWRLDSFPVTEAPAFRLDSLRFRFDSAGFDTQLYIHPHTEDRITHLAGPDNVPAPSTRRGLLREKALYYGPDEPQREKSILVSTEAGPVADVRICDLSDTNGGSRWAHMPASGVAIDPVLGRIAFVAPPAEVRVSYYYGFSAEIGGGEYGRVATFATDLQPVVRVPSQFPSIQAAFGALPRGGAIVIEDNNYYVENLSLDVPASTKIELRAAEERRPTLVFPASVSVTGGENSELVVNGVRIVGGSFTVPDARLGGNNLLRQLVLRHVTMVPAATPAIGTSSPAQPAGPRIVVAAPASRLVLEKTITGPLRTTGGATVRILDSIVDAAAAGGFAYAGLAGTDAGASLEVRNATILGPVHARAITLASNTIFDPGNQQPGSPVAVRAERLQEGCVRFCYVPPGSVVPRMHRCQPATAAGGSRIRPVYTSTRYSDAGYCQLTLSTPREIREGADDGAEMGVFHDLFQPQRVANLRARIDEYLRFGLEAGVLFGS